MRLSIKILLAFLLVLILSIIDTASNYLLSLKVKENSEFLNKSQDIIRNSARLHKEMIQMQSSLRGFMLLKDSSLLDEFNRGLVNVPSIMNEQRKLTQENAEQVRLLDSIQELHQQWINIASAIIDSIKYPSFKSPGFFAKTLHNEINDQITRDFVTFDRSEYALRSMHQGNLIESIGQTHTYSLTFFTLTIIIGVASTIYVISLITKRIRSMSTLADNISKGIFTQVIDKHKDELTGLSNSLNVMSAGLQKNITELERRNEELDKFAYVVSHDLKAPLRGIHNAINWIEEDLKTEITPKMREYLNIIPQRTERMESLINGLLDYARTRERTEPEQVDVALLVKEIVESIVPGNIAVSIKNLPVIVTEKIKLEQVFNNLISNAVKSMDKDDSWIMVDCTENDTHNMFSVEDNGIGIAYEYHEKIFQMFQTLREKGEKESTGIGLAIIKKILDDKHCSIYVDSVPGKGSTFIFTWPKNG
jgi:signal transduction histidine kinase